jgi:hypothetical protein
MAQMHMVWMKLDIRALEEVIEIIHARRTEKNVNLDIAG